MTKITSSTGRTLSVDKKSHQVWVSGDKENSFCCIGELVNKIGNPNRAYGVEPIQQKKYYPIDNRWLRYAKKLHISKLRLLLSKERRTSNGQKLLISYGYIRRERFSYLLKHRKKCSNEFQSIILLKYSDMKIKGE